MRKIIVLSGGFDPVHVGHMRMFEDAKKYGADVIVGVNSDEWLTRKKGAPFMNFDERTEILRGVKYIDLVLSFNDDDNSACNLIKKVQEIYKKEDVKIFFGNGGDRTNKTTPEIDYCNQENVEMLWGVGGGKIQSSSELIAKSKSNKIWFLSFNKFFF